MKNILALFITSLLMFAVGAYAGNFNVGQKNKQFTKKKLVIKVGDKIRFTNEDPFFHNVFSLSPTKTFDLGSYPKGEFREVTFDTAGTIDVECAIHPHMRMTVVVK